MTGLAHEALKGIEGLCRNDTGRLLNARHLAWGITRIMTVRCGVLLTGDNTFYTQTATAPGPEHECVRRRRAAFGLEDRYGVVPRLREQVTAALRLYALTAALLAPVLAEEDVPLIEHVTARIHLALAPHD